MWAKICFAIVKGVSRIDLGVFIGRFVERRVLKALIVVGVEVGGSTGRDIDGTGVCMCCHPTYSGRHTCGRISRGHREGHTGFPHLPSAVLALIIIARRIQPFFSLIDREVEFFVPTIQSFSTCWA